MNLFGCTSTKIVHEFYMYLTQSTCAHTSYVHMYVSYNHCTCIMYILLIWFLIWINYTYMYKFISDWVLQYTLNMQCVRYVHTVKPHSILYKLIWIKLPVHKVHILFKFETMCVHVHVRIYTCTWSSSESCTCTIAASPQFLNNFATNLNYTCACMYFSLYSEHTCTYQSNNVYNMVLLINWLCWDMI